MKDGGAIINLLSPGSDRYLPKYAPVGVSKGALESLTKYLAVELAPRGIRVNAVSAGLVEGTDGVRMLDQDMVGDYEAKIPAGRHVLPDGRRRGRRVPRVGCGEDDHRADAARRRRVLAAWRDLETSLRQGNEKGRSNCDRPFVDLH